MRASRLFAAIVVGIVLFMNGNARADVSGGPVPEWTAIEPVSGERVPVLRGGRLYHLVFFATWCPPCVDELPFLADLDARWGEDGYRLVIVAVSTRQDRDRLRRFLEQRRVPGTLLYDIRDDVRAELDVTELPTHVILDADGTELLRGPALSEGVAERIESEMRRPQ